MSYRLSNYSFFMLPMLASVLMLTLSACEDECTCHNICGIEDLYGTWHQDIHISTGQSKNIYYTFSDDGFDVSSDQVELFPTTVSGAEPWLDTRLPYFQDKECRLAWVQQDLNSNHFGFIWRIIDFNGKTLTVTIVDPRPDTAYIENLELIRIK